MKDVTNTMSHTSFVGSMDITGKFVLSIVAGLIVLFFVATLVVVKQESGALGDLLQFSEKIVGKVTQKNTDKLQADEEAKVKRLILILKQIAPSAVVDLEMSTLESYGNVILQDPNMSYVGFFNTEGETLASLGSKESISADHLINEDLKIEGIKVGTLAVGYNFDRLNLYVRDSQQQQQQNLKHMTSKKDSALNTAKLSLFAILLVMCLAVAGMVSYLFKTMVFKRLLELNRLHDIVAREGDLRQRIEVTSDDTIGRMGRHFNAFLNTIHGTITPVVAASGQLTSSSKQMSTITKESSSDIVQQNSEIDLAATAINEMAATVQEVARNASTAAEAAQNADTEAKNGMQVVTQTIDSINELAGEVDHASDVIQKLEEDSNAIGVVLDVIRGIAEQTNLLALNAAIEAARAGEQGRGFAVVADEVRTLASRTQQSTEEIQQMIEKLQNGTSNAVKVMESGRNRAKHSVERAAEAGTSLETITKSVAVISDMNVQIASAAEQQGAVAEEINRNIVSISEIAKKSTTGADKIASSSVELNGLATELRGLVKKFKV